MKCGADPNCHRFGFPLLYNEVNLAEDPKLEDLESLRDFTRVSSDFYADLASHYSKIIDDWYSVRKREIQVRPGLVPSRTVVRNRVNPQAKESFADYSLSNSWLVNLSVRLFSVTIRTV